MIMRNWHRQRLVAFGCNFRLEGKIAIAMGAWGQGSSSKTSGLSRQLRVTSGCSSWHQRRHHAAAGPRCPPLLCNQGAWQWHA